MKGDSPLLVAQEDGHSVETMLRTYAAWIKGAKPEDIERIKQAIASRPTSQTLVNSGIPHSPLRCPKAVSRQSPENRRHPE